MHSALLPDLKALPSAADAAIATARAQAIAAAPAGGAQTGTGTLGQPTPTGADAALALYATVLSAQSLDAAAHALVAALVARHGLRCASIGLHQDGRTRLLARSHLDPSQPPSEVSQAVLGAMDEAITQSVGLCAPAPAGAAPQDHILIEHLALQRLQMASVASLPFGSGGEVFGALSVERDLAQPFSAAELDQLALWLTLAAPALRWMQQGGEPWARRTRRDLGHAVARLRQPDRATARRLLAAGAALLLFVALAPLQREVGGRARIEGAEQRVLVAPADGFVKRAHVQPGDHVRAGDPLVDLLDGDLRLERERWASQLAQHENGYAAAMAKADRSAAATSLARGSEAQSQLALVDGQLARSQITAPFDALVIQGDLRQSIGAPVRQGDTLLTLAAAGRHRVIVEVDEVDIARVAPGQAGSLALSSLPWDRQDVVVERIVPLAKAVDGRNVFEVEARLAAPRADIRPGLLGRADIVIGRMPPLWAWAGHALDRVRVAWWAWIG